MLEILLFMIGIALGIWWWSVIVLPLFYGIPKATYYVWKGVLRKSAITFYLTSFILWIVIFFVVSIILVKYFSNISRILMESGGFAIGQLIGIGACARRVFTKSGRQDLRADFWDIMLAKYLDTKNPNFKDVFASTLTRLFIQKFGDEAEQKVKEFLDEAVEKEEGVV